MSTDADRAAAEKAEADKKAAEDAAVAATVTAAAWPIGGYTSLIPRVFFCCSSTSDMRRCFYYVRSACSVRS